MKITEQISIWGGQYFYENKVTVKNVPVGAKLVTGIPDFYKSVMVPVKDSDMAVLVTLGKQSENADTLGMAIIMQGKNIEFEKANDLKSTIKDAYLVAQKITTAPIVYRYYAIWQLTDPMFAHIKFYKNFLKAQAKLSSHPTIIH